VGGKPQLKVCPPTAEPPEMINKPLLTRKKLRLLTLSPLRAAAVVPKSVTFLLLIRKILTTHFAEQKRKSPLTMIMTTLTTRMTAETSDKTKGKLLLVS